MVKHAFHFESQIVNHTPLIGKTKFSVGSISNGTIQIPNNIQIQILHFDFRNKISQTRQLKVGKKVIFSAHRGCNECLFELL